MTDSIKIIGGSPQPGNPATIVVVSAKVNADGKLPEIKPEGERVINGSPQPGHKPPRVIVPGNAQA
jgi:hypothetical protein